MPTLKVHELNERAEALGGVDVFELIERVRVSSVEYGKLKAKVEYLEHYRKSKLAIIVEELKRQYVKYEVVGTAKSVSLHQVKQAIRAGVLIPSNTTTARVYQLKPTLRRAA